MAAIAFAASAMSRIRLLTLCDQSTVFRLHVNRHQNGGRKGQPQREQEFEICDTGPDCLRKTVSLADKGGFFAGIIDAVVLSTRPARTTVVLSAAAPACSRKLAQSVSQVLAFEVLIHTPEDAQRCLQIRQVVPFC